MLFLTAIDRMNKKELVDLLATIEGTTYWGSMKETSSVALAAGKNLTARGLKAVSRFTCRQGEKIAVSTKRGADKLAQGMEFVADGADSLSDKLDDIPYEPFQIIQRIEQLQEELDQLTESDLKTRLVKNISTLVSEPETGVSDTAEMERLSRKVLAKVAKKMKIDTNMVPPEDVERLIFEKAVENQLETIKKRLTKITPDEEEKLEKTLREELEKLSSGDAKAIREAMNLDELSARSMISVLKGGGIAVGSIAALNMAGFGVFMAATTMLKAISLLLGVTFAFGTYAATTTFIGFLLGPLGAGLIIGGTIGGLFTLGHSKFDKTMLTTLVTSLHARLLTE